MTERQLIDRFLDLQEHPEQVTEEQLRQLLEDGQMRELVEQMAFAKRTFKNQEAWDEESAFEEEWARFAAAHSAELDALDDGGPSASPSELRSLVPEEAHGFTFFKLHFGKYAAAFFGVLMASGIALAAIHIVRHVTQRQQPVTETVTATETLPTTDMQHSVADMQQAVADSSVVEPRVFDNVPLDSMLLEVAEYYQVAVEFQRDETRLLRLHFDWKPTDSIDRVVERLNHFEAVNIILEPKKMIVK